MKVTPHILFLLVCLIIGACSTDEPRGEESKPGNSLPDPEETVTVSLYKNSGADIDGIYIDASDSFTSENGWMFASLGAIKGLGSVTEIPWDGWASTAKVKKGNGYIAYSPLQNKFYRLFVSNSATDEMGTLTGFQIKYQQPFYGADDILTFDSSEFSASFNGGTLTATFTTSSLIPVSSIETDCDWITPQSINYGILIDRQRGITFTISPTSSLSPSVGHIYIKNFHGSSTVITINRQALIPWEATTTIYNLKKEYWDAAKNYTRQINPSTIIRGKVVSSDQDGNIYKSLCVDDGTAAISLSINAYNIYTQIPYGQ